MIIATIIFLVKIDYFILCDPYFHPSAFYMNIYKQSDFNNTFEHG